MNKRRSRKLTVLLGVLVIVGLLAFANPKDAAPVPYRFPVVEYFPKMPLPQSNSVTEEGVELGRFLFYDPILSKDSSMSCATCHRQEKAFSDSPNRFSKGINAEFQKRNTMPLFNLAWYEAFFWDGRAANLEEQVFVPVRAHNELDLEWALAEKRIERNEFYQGKFAAAFGPVPIDSVFIAKAIAQFERSLISHNSKYDRVLRGEAYFTADEYDGFILANDQTMGGCLHCHTTDADGLGTTGKFSNNGLDDVADPMKYTDLGKGGATGDSSDNGLFKIPSLRNLGFTAPYMHDGRFGSLREVMDFYSEGVHNSANVDSKMGSAHMGGAHLTEEEKMKILAFLNTLNDSVFVREGRFSDPFGR